uniref:DUF973 family protein n=1 Tax=Candidatus Aramenus sulfurataquae TaxID=1326980 RepID=A0A0F2LNT3_9CREN
MSLKTKKSKKGISGAVTALILVIASVIITLSVVGFAFGLFGAFGGTPQVTQIGTGIININGGYATFDLHSTGNVQIVSATIVGTTYSASPASITVGSGGNTLTAGVNSVTVNFGTVNLQPGATYTISLGLSDGATVSVAVVAQ